MGAESEGLMGHTTKIEIVRYKDPADVAGWDGYIEDQGKTWILYFSDGGATKFYPRRNPDGSVVEEQAISGASLDDILAVFAARVALPATPVLVWAGMETPDHSETRRPLAGSSPLVKLTLAALNSGVGPDRLVFDVTGERMIEGVAFTIGEGDGGIDASVEVPRKVYSWCSLNRCFFGDWVAWGGVPIDCEHGQLGATFDQSNEAHRDGLGKLAAYFEAKGWVEAADDLRSELKP